MHQWQPEPSRALPTRTTPPHPPPPYRHKAARWWHYPWPRRGGGCVMCPLLCKASEAKIPCVLWGTSIIFGDMPCHIVGIYRRLLLIWRGRLWYRNESVEVCSFWCPNNYNLIIISLSSNIDTLGRYWCLHVYCLLLTKIKELYSHTWGGNLS